MKKLLITEQEKRRILEMHYKKSNNRFVNEITTTSPEFNITPPLTQEEGNEFRSWVNANKTDIKQKYDLDPTGSPNNQNIMNAWKEVGREFVNSKKEESTYKSLQNKSAKDMTSQEIKLYIKKQQEGEASQLDIDDENVKKEQQNLTMKSSNTISSWDDNTINFWKNTFGNYMFYYYPIPESDVLADKQTGLWDVERADGIYQFDAKTAYASTSQVNPDGASDPDQVWYFDSGVALKESTKNNPIQGKEDLTLMVEVAWDSADQFPKPQPIVNPNWKLIFKYPEPQVTATNQNERPGNVPEI